MKKLALLLSALALVLATTMFVSCSDDDTNEAPTETIFPPTDGIMARAMLIAHQWNVPLEVLQQWNNLHHFEYYSTYKAELDEALFCMLNDHAYLAIHVKADATTHVTDRDKWLCARIYESNETCNYNLNPIAESPAEGMIYDDDNNLRLEYQLLTNRSMQLIVADNKETFAINLSPRPEIVELTF